MTIRFKLGRQPRSFSPSIPHLSSLLGSIAPVIPPDSVDWTKGVKDYGMMLNDQLGCCTCAAVYHARQIWTLNTTGEDTVPDDDVLELYENACGYVPGDPSTDQGGNEQDVLTYLLKTGMPISGDHSGSRIKAFLEVDPRNSNDIKNVINQCGVCYIGFNVPNNIDETPGSTWTLDKSASIEGGHAVVCVSYNEDTVTVISWGALYHLSWEFFTFYTDEAYAIIDKLWTKDGKTPLGLSEAQLQGMMAALKSEV